MFSLVGHVVVAEDSETQEEKEFLPQKADGLEGVFVVDACAGDSHTACLSKDGRVFACGCFRVSLICLPYHQCDAIESLDAHPSMLSCDVCMHHALSGSSRCAGV